MALTMEEPLEGVGSLNHSRREQAMWRAVITQALMDASSQSAKSEALYEKSQALCWLTGYSEDFKTVCDYAGLSPAYVRRSAIAALKRGCKWRMDSAATHSPKK
jgi:hypothetical protein